MSVRIGVWGDSVSAGFKDSEMGGWVNRLRMYFLNTEEYSSVQNCSVSGTTTHWLLKRFHIEAEARTPDIVIFSIGKNDTAEVYNVDEKTFESNLNKLIKEAGDFSKKIIFIGIGNIDESKTTPFPKGQIPYYYNKSIQKYNSIIERVCQENEFIFVPMYGDLDIEKDLFDGVHPNASGHEKIFRKVLPVIKGIIDGVKE